MATELWGSMVPLFCVEHPVAVISNDAVTMQDESLLSIVMSLIGIVDFVKKFKSMRIYIPSRVFVI